MSRMLPLLEMGKLDDTSSQTVGGIENTLFYDEIFSDVLLYYRVLSISDEFTFDTIHRLVSECTLGSGISKTTDTRSRAQYFFSPPVTLIKEKS